MASLTGAQKAALVVLYLGEEAASSVLAGLEDGEIAAIATALKTASRFAPQDVTATLEEFSGLLRSPQEISVGGETQMRAVLTRSLPPGRAGQILAKVSGEPTPVDADLQSLPARDLYRLIAAEHPQIQAAVLTLVDPSRVPSVIAEFPLDVRAEVLGRLARMRTIPRRRLVALQELIGQRAKRLRIETGVPLGGERAVATILNRLPGDDAEAVLGALETQEAELAGRVRKMMFVFEDLVQVDDRGFQGLLKEVPRETLVSALAVAGEAVRDKFFSNMSSGASGALREDIEAAGPVRVGDVEVAQEAILEIARTLERDGKLIRRRDGGAR